MTHHTELLGGYHRGRGWKVPGDHVQQGGEGQEECHHDAQPGTNEMNEDGRYKQTEITEHSNDMNNPENTP